jgi:twitching motility protein PilT
MQIAELLAYTHKMGASDLHITVGTPPSIRLNGVITPTQNEVLDRKMIHDMIYQILTESQKSKFESEHELDFSVDLQGVARFRVNAYLTRLGEAAAFRLIPKEIPSMEQLRLPKIIAKLTELERGLVLVTGPTGSGKSTTLASLIDMINRGQHKHIITLEDPIEYIHQHNQCIINQREVGTHTHSFANALRGALREDPDVILVGEMRDLETIQLAIQAAQTGHLVFSTLHTMSAAQTIDRMVNVFSADQQEQIRTELADAIEAVISQTLVPTVDGSGRVAGIEIMIANSAIRNLIRDNKDFQIPTTIQLNNKLGMQTLDQSLVLHTKAGLIDREAALKKSYDKTAYLQLLAGKTPLIGDEYQ